jgi:hypothetical protein
MSDLFEQLTTHLTDKQIGHWSNHEEKAICVDFPGIVGFYRVIAQIGSLDGQFHAWGQVRLDVPKGCRAAVADLLELANDQRTDGDAELNEEASELRFHTAENLTGDELSGEMVDRLINTARFGVETHLRAILCVMFGNEQPADALRHALL